MVLGWSHCPSRDLGTGKGADLQGKQTRKSTFLICKMMGDARPMRVGFGGLWHWWWRQETGTWLEHGWMFTHRRATTAQLETTDTLLFHLQALLVRRRALFLRRWRRDNAYSYSWLAWAASPFNRVTELIVASTILRTCWHYVHTLLKAREALIGGRTRQLTSHFLFVWRSASFSDTGRDWQAEHWAGNTSRKRAPLVSGFLVMPPMCFQPAWLLTPLGSVLFVVCHLSR